MADCKHNHTVHDTRICTTWIFLYAAVHEHRWLLVFRSSFKQRDVTLSDITCHETAPGAQRIITGSLNWPQKRRDTLNHHLSQTNGDFLTLFFVFVKVESPLLVKAARCARWEKTGWGVTRITSWIWTRFEPAVSEPYGNHAVMNCCLLCSLQGAALNILQWICSHRDVPHTRT